MAMSSWDGSHQRDAGSYGADAGIFAGQASFQGGHNVLVATRDPLRLRQSIAAMRALGLCISLVLNPPEVVSRALAVQSSAVVVSAEHDPREAAVVCARLRLETGLRRVPLIVVLSSAQRGLRRQFYDLGVTGCVVMDGEAEELSLKVGALIRHLAPPASAHGQAVEAEAQEGAGGSVVRQLCQFLLGKLGQMVSIEDVEQRFGMERRSLNRMFVQETGQTVFAWYLDQRMELAKRLLREGGLPIQQIASDLGYSSVCNFSTAFRLKCGESPRQYRAQASPHRERGRRVASQHGNAVAWR